MGYFKNKDDVIKHIQKELDGFGIEYTTGAGENWLKISGIITVKDEKKQTDFIRRLCSRQMAREAYLHISVEIWRGGRFFILMSNEYYRRNLPDILVSLNYTP